MGEGKIRGLLLITSVLMVFVGCGSTGSSDNDKDENLTEEIVQEREDTVSEEANVSEEIVRETFDKAYYSGLDYSDLDQLSEEFLDRESRFVDFETMIPLPQIVVKAFGKTYKLDTVSEENFDDGSKVLVAESSELSYEQYQENGLVQIEILDKASDQELVGSFDESQINRIDNPEIEGDFNTSYRSANLEVMFPDDMIANGNAGIVYNHQDDFALIEDGSLGLKLFNKMVDITQNYPNIKEIRLKNIDGSVHDDINMQTGLMLRKAGLNTYVLESGEEGTDIASGGVDLFQAGVKRAIENSESVTLGIHSWSESNEEGVSLEGKDFPKDHKDHHDKLLYILAVMGVDLGYDFYFHTLEVADANSIHPMSAEELSKYKILN